MGESREGGGQNRQSSPEGLCALNRLPGLRLAAGEQLCYVLALLLGHLHDTRPHQNSIQLLQHDICCAETCKPAMPLDWDVSERNPFEPAEGLCLKASCSQ